MSYTTPWTQASTITSPGVYVAFPAGTGHCPPQDNTDVQYVQVSIRHTVQTFIPGLQYLPGLGTCDSNGCHVDIASEAQFRLEPHP